MKYEEVEIVKAAIDAYLDTLFPSRPRVLGRYYASEIGSCLRQQYYRFFIQKQLDQNTKRVFWIGTVWDKELSGILSNFPQHNEERSLEAVIEKGGDELIIAGRYDDFIFLEVGNQKVIVEGKTAKSVNARHEPSPPHLMQLNFYLRDRTLADYGLLVYFGKSDAFTREFKVFFSKEIWNEMKARAWAHHESVKKKELPPPESKRSKTRSWECSYCDHKSLCEKNFNEVGV